MSFFLGSWEMNRSAEQTNPTRTASRFTRLVCSALQFISHEPRKKDTHSLKKITFSIYTCIYISFTCCWVRLNLITLKKKEGAHVGCAPIFGQNKCSNFAKYLIIFCSLKCKIVNNKKNWLASLANFTILLFSKLS